MTDRIRTLTVVLDRDMRDDDVEVVVKALSCIKHVSKVELGPATAMEQHIASDDFRRSMGMLLHRIIGAGCGMGGDEDRELLSTCRSAAALHKEKRGY